MKPSLVAILIAVFAGCSSSSNNPSNPAPDAGVPTAAAVTAACQQWCTQSVANDCPYSGDAGADGCVSAECDFAGVAGSCLKLAKAYYDCALAAADMCKDCSNEFDGLESCH